MSSLPTPKSPISASPKDLIRFLVWKDSKGKTKIHVPSCPNFGSHSKWKCSCPSGLAAGTVNSTIGKLRSILKSIGRSGEWSGLSPGNPAAHPSFKKYLASVSARNKQKQGSPLAKPYLFSSTSSLNCAPTFVSGHFFHPYPPWKGTSRAVIWLSSASISTPVTEHLTSAVFILKRFSCFLESKAYCFTTSSRKRFEERTPISSLLRNALMTAQSVPS